MRNQEAFFAKENASFPFNTELTRPKSPVLTDGVRQRAVKSNMDSTKHLEWQSPSK